MSTTRGRHSGIKTASPSRRYELIRGVYLHLAIFAAVVLAMFVVNANTRGPDGGWWVVWPIQLWSIAWGFHLWGVAVGSQVREVAQ